MTETQWHNVWLKIQPWAKRSTITVLAMLLAVSGFLIGSSPATGADTGLSRLDLARTELANCQLLLQVATGSAQRSRANNCITDQNAIIKALTATPTTSPSASASPSLSPSPSPTVTTPAPTTPAPTTTSPTTPAPTTTSPTIGPTGRACPAFPAMPNAACTGPNPAVTLRACSIPFNTIATNGQVVDGCIIQGELDVRANNVVIRNSIIRGRVDTGYGEQSGLVLTDVEIDGQNSDPNGQSGIGDDNYTCIRCNVHNTGRGAAFGDNVTIRDSWFHDFFKTPGAHQSAAGSNGGGNNQIIHNNLDCQETSCSGALVMYGDFAPVNNVLVQNNLFNSPGSYCTYAGSTGTASGKPYPHGTNIRYLDNLWGKKYTPICGMYGPVTSWEYNTGNVWSGNRWQDGSGPVTP
jgi:hypothetical protein